MQSVSLIHAKPPAQTSDPPSHDCSSFLQARSFLPHSLVRLTPTARRMRVTDLPGAVLFHEHQGLESTGVDLALSHPRLQAVFRDGVRGVGSQHSNDSVAVRELKVLEVVELRTEVVVAVVGPAAIDSTSLVDRDLRMVESRKLVEILDDEGGVVTREPALDDRPFILRRSRCRHRKQSPRDPERDYCKP